MKNILRIIFCFSVLAFGLGGCTVSGLMSNVVSAVGDAGKDENALIFDLSAPASFSVRRRMKDVALTIHKPRAIKSLERTSILVKTKENEIAVLPAVSWVDKLPRLLQSRLQETFENVRAVGSVSNGRDRIKSNYGLDITIRAFQINVNGSRGDAVVALYVKFIHKRSGKVMGQKLFKSAYPVNPEDVRQSAAGLNRGFNTVARKIVRWVVTRRTETDFVN